MTRSSSSRRQRVLAAGRRCAHLCSRCRKCSVFPEKNRTCPPASLRRLRQFPSLQWRSRDRWLSRWLAELKVTPTRRLQESFWHFDRRRGLRITGMLGAAASLRLSWDQIRRLLRRWEVEMLRSVKKMLNGANGMSDMHGIATRVVESEAGAERMK